ncbi:hypothetical protein K493DRAFT_405219 [Basidiobolus meristosporus CBS 931.73]|uniref:Uncharacterized protein n=1 Tax=Basidiobolus meristosporus CBS 931.73 TaxID=1314790 RepID=A0A1Y1YX14_9FUNG|nr:hypothetical protein K493DRAFT_405219 [Basidiobolus meristosporus CBS 931.73]|eukprot:ORY02603.1 hypothetical protein K493DRAFT_405219 [Basidiobolus meristosporus CBS 931.73]
MSTENLEVLDSSYDEHEDPDYIEDDIEEGDDDDDDEEILESISPNELLHLVRDNEEIDEVDKAILLDLARALGEEVDESQDVAEIIRTLESLLLDEDDYVVEDLDSEEED